MLYLFSSRLIAFTPLNFQESEGVVTCLDETRHGYEDGDYVTFEEVQV